MLEFATGFVLFAITLPPIVLCVLVVALLLSFAFLVVAGVILYADYANARRIARANRIALALYKAARDARRQHRTVIYTRIAGKPIVANGLYRGA